MKNTRYPVIYLTDRNMLLPMETLTDRVKAEVMKTLVDSGAEKVNLLGWSRWGLAARAAASQLPERIASVTTVCTPHRGLRASESPLGRPAVKCWTRCFGGRTEGFSLAVSELSPGFMRSFNEKYPNARGVYYQSCACAMGKNNDRALAPANSILSILDGENDGVVSV
ncbi:MAG: hypothetical protein HUJ66_06265, partial [Oscillospiraceae bacterium]|nr:hypothetical protein [Oscillospiraceae bacterium]